MCSLAATVVTFAAVGKERKEVIIGNESEAKLSCRDVRTAAKRTSLSDEARSMTCL